MARKIKVGIIGSAGNVASVCIGALLHRGADIVCGVEIRRIGEDVGAASGSEPIGIATTDVANLEDTVKATMPDVMLDCSLNTVEEIFPQAKTCMENGVNYMPVGIVCYNPRVAAPELARELDEIGKRTGASYLGSGSAELWQSIPLVLSALSGKFTKVRLVFNALLDGFGEESSAGMGFGAPPEEWESLAYDGEEEGPSMWIGVDTLFAEKCGLHVTGYETKNDIVPAKADVSPADLDYTIKEGCLVGYMETGVVHTEEGIDIESVSYFKYGEGGETNSFTVEFDGEPDIRMAIEDFHGAVTTSTIMVNRIPDLIGAPGGVVMVNDLPFITYKSAAAFEIE
ncbi:MAG: hypothetical protein LBS67_06850 [Clostridiales Family XIII bacterium]|nr:hypothetical protein [Clostridiales Family XIII bacterium]